MNRERALAPPGAGMTGTLRPAAGRSTEEPASLTPGAGVTVGVIDTGIDLGHWEFDPDRITETLLSGASDEDGLSFSHGTAVASLIAAQRGGDPGPPSESLRQWDFHGIAWGVDLKMFAIPLGTGDPNRDYAPISLSDLDDFDTRMADRLRAALADEHGVDILNMSFATDGLVENYAAADLRTGLDDVIETATQSGRRDADKTLLVWAASNDHGAKCAEGTDNCIEVDPETRKGTIDASSPSVLGALPVHVEALRSHSVSVVATTRDDGSPLASFSNRCGVAAKWCIAAPGADLVIAYFGPWLPSWSPVPVPGRGYTKGGGTSYAAPLVAGGLALLKQYFRGQMGNTEVLTRLYETAAVTPDPVASGEQCPEHLDLDDDRSACELSSTHGRGLMDLKAATEPVGTLGTGVPGSVSPLWGTALRTPSAWGDVSRRMGLAEIAAFDERNAPFWLPLGARVAPAAAGVPVPSFADEAPDGGGGGGVAWRGLSWAALGGAEGAPRGALRLAYAADGDVGAAGLSWGAPGGALRTGLVLEQGAIMGSRGEGAFAGGAVHGLAFGTLARSFALGEGEDGGPSGLRLSVSSTLAGGRLAGESGMLAGSGGLYSQHRLALERTDGARFTRLFVEQPLRAESGSVRFRRPVGRTRAGDWVYRDLEVGLRPGARAFTLGAHHERPLGEGRIAFGASHTLDAGHVPGEEEAWVGARYRRRF